MALESCSIADLAEASGCFLCDLHGRERTAARVYFLALGLAAAGGDDLTNVNDAVEASKCLICGPARDQIEAFRVAIAQAQAATLGADTDLTITELRAAIKCFACLDKGTLDRILAELECQISQLSA